MSTIKARTALVTGAGRGIGRAAALALASQGIAVVAVARTGQEVEQVASEIIAQGGRALALPGDVAKDADVRRITVRALDEFGAVDILLNNAGYNVLGPIGELDPDAWWAQVEVNLRGPYLFCRALVPQMVERGWGRIINVSSVAGKIGMKYASAYCSAKHGVIGLTRALAIELADKGVTVNAICPGYVTTALTDSTAAQRAALFGITVDAVVKNALDKIPQHVLMDPQELVAAILFLASDGAARITGEAMNISAGLVMH